MYIYIGKRKKEKIMETCSIKIQYMKNGYQTRLKAFVGICIKHAVHTGVGRLIRPVTMT